MKKFIDNLVDDIIVIAHSAQQTFWELADRADQTRTRLHYQRQLVRLADRETVLHQELGELGFTLLQDGVSVSRTPELHGLLRELREIEARRERLRGILDTQVPGHLTVTWSALAKLLETGEWVVQEIRLSESSAWCGRQITGAMPPGLCLAVKRGDSLYPFTRNVTCVDGDALVVLMPSTSLAAWERWVRSGSADPVDPL